MFKLNFVTNYASMCTYYSKWNPLSHLENVTAKVGGVKRRFFSNKYNLYI